MHPTRPEHGRAEQPRAKRVHFRACSVKDVSLAGCSQSRSPHGRGEGPLHLTPNVNELASGGDHRFPHPSWHPPQAPRRDLYRSNGLVLAIPPTEEEGGGQHGGSASSAWGHLVVPLGRLTTP
jgi:hypothetical protein